MLCAYIGFFWKLLIHNWNVSSSPIGNNILTELQWTIFLAFCILFSWLYAIGGRSSLPLRCLGCRFTWNHCACAPMLYISELFEDCTIANEINYEIDYAWPSIHDNGQGVTACDVLLQQCIVDVCMLYTKQDFIGWFVSCFILSD